MKKIFLTILAITQFSLSALAVDNGDVDTRISRAVGAMEDLMSPRESSIPTELMRGAKCIASLRIIKAGFIWGAKGGSGVASCKKPGVNGAEATWSAPVFLTLGGLSYGFQFGVERIDLTLVFTNRDAEESLTSDNFALSANGGITAGPEGRELSAGTNYKLEDAIYSYSRSKGLYAGLTLDGAMLSIDHEYNNFVYGNKNAREILGIGGDTAPAQVKPYMNKLGVYSK